MLILKIMGFVLIAIILVIAVGVIIAIARYLMWFHWRSCKHCGDLLEFKGETHHGPNDEECYAFECPKCGAWEYVSKQDFFKDCSNDITNNNNMTLV